MHPTLRLLLMDVEFAVYFPQGVEPTVDMWSKKFEPPEGLSGVNAFAYDVYCSGRSIKAILGVSTVALTPPESDRFEIGLQHTCYVRGRCLASAFLDADRKNGQPRPEAPTNCLGSRYGDAKYRGGPAPASLRLGPRIFYCVS